MKTKLLYYLIIICMLYLPKQTFSQVIYTNINPDKIVVDSFLYFHQNYGWQAYSDSEMVDINNDGIIDFQFNFINTRLLSWNDGLIRLDVVGLGNNTISCDGPAWQLPLRHSWSDMIDGNLYYLTSGHLFNHEFYDPFYSCNFHTGYWRGMFNDGYLGLKFEVNGQFYFGWIRLSMIVDSHTFIIQDYAYEASGNAILAGDGMSTGINEFDKSDKVIIYPNPSNEFVNINLPTEITSSNNHFDFFINDPQGRCIKTFHDVKNNFGIDVRLFEKGIYFYSLVNKDKNLYTGKIVIQ